MKAKIHEAKGFWLQGEAPVPKLKRVTHIDWLSQRLVQYSSNILRTDLAGNIFLVAALFNSKYLFTNTKATIIVLKCRGRA